MPNLFQSLDVNSLVSQKGDFVVFPLPARFSQTAFRGLLGVVCLGVGLVVMLSGRTCKASCGDYVILRGSHANMQVAEETSNLPAPAKAPCNSPTCRSEFPQLPVPSPPPSSSPSEKPLALFADSLDLESNTTNGDWLASSEHPRPGFRSLLQRPPSL